MNRARLQILVGIESVVLMVLVALALRSPAPELLAESPPAVTVRDTDPAPAVASRPAPGSAPASSPGERRSEVTGSTQAVDATTLLFGTVRSTDGAALEECMVRAWRPASPRGGRSLFRVQDCYALAGLLPGTWELSVKATGHREHKATLELDGQPPRRRHDVALERALLVKVKFLTPEGTPLQDVKDIRPTARFFPIIAVATRRQPPGNLPMTENREWSGLGLAEWIANDPGGVRSGRALALPMPWAGQLDLREPPPCFVSAVYRHVVLGTQALSPGQSELSFTIDPERVKGCLASAKLRVLDARTKAAVAGARVRLDDRQTGSMGAPTDAQGDVTLTGLAPGLLHLGVTAPGYERVSRYERLAPGATQDLGTLELNAPVKLTGTVTDRDGKPVAAEVSCLRLDRPAFPQPTDLAFRATAKDDGTFELMGLGPTQYLVRARIAGQVGPVVRVDLTDGDVPPIKLLLQPSVEVTLDLKYGRDESYLVQAVDETGALLSASRWTGGNSVPMRLLAGSYALELYDDQELLRRIPLRVGTTPLRVEVRP